jgi:hypothetical protein
VKEVYVLYVVRSQCDVRICANMNTCDNFMGDMPRYDMKLRLSGKSMLIWYKILTKMWVYDDMMYMWIWNEMWCNVGKGKYGLIYDCCGWYVMWLRFVK